MFKKRNYPAISLLVIFVCSFATLPSCVFAQQKKSLLIVPISVNNIKFSPLVERNLKYNHVHPDSIKEYVVNIIDKTLTGLFKNYSIYYLKEFNNSAVLTDSIYKIKKWNCFYFNFKDSSVKNIQNVRGTSINSYHNNYYGCDLTTNGYKILKEAVNVSKCDYILFINRFEIINPNSIFSLHMEVMDKELKKIYGNKNEINRAISKSMYYEVLKYYIKLSTDDMLGKMNIYLNDIE